MGFESRHRGGISAREELVEALARAHHLELERSRDVLRRAEQSAAEDPQARSVRHWFEILVEEDAREAVGKQVAREPIAGGRGSRARSMAKPVPGRQTLVSREAQHEHEHEREPRLPREREPKRLDVGLRWSTSQAFGFDLSGVSIRRDGSTGDSDTAPSPARPESTAELRAEAPELGSPAHVLSQLGAGVPFDDATRERLDGAMGDDFSDVQVHTDALAGRLAGGLDALAFTVGNHIAFAPGRFQPDTLEGDALLAHELTHVQQQRGADPATAHSKQPSTSASAHEEDADRGAGAALSRLYGGFMHGGLPAGGRAGPATKSGVELRCAREPPGGTKAPQPVKTEDYTFRTGQDEFVVSFELMPPRPVGGHRGAAMPVHPGDIRIVIQPVNWSRVYTSQLKYWNSSGKEVDKDSSWISMGNHSVPAVPFVKNHVIPDRTKFKGAFPQEVTSGDVKGLTYDLDGDGTPDFSIRCQSNISNIMRTHDFTVYANNVKPEKFDFHYIQNDAWKHGYSGNISPRRKEDDFFDVLKDVIDVGVSMIPIVGDIVDLAEAVSGYTKWGEKMTTGQRVVTALATLIPIAGGAVLRKALKGGATLAEAATKMGRQEDEVIAALKAIDDRSADKAAIDAMAASTKAGRELTEYELKEVARILHDIDSQKRVYRAVEQATGTQGVLRRGGKAVGEAGPVSLKRLRNILGRAGVSPSPYHLRKASQADLDAMKASGQDPANVWAWVNTDGAGKAITDGKGKPIINFTERGLSSLEEAVKSFGHEVQHLKDFAAGRGTTEAGAEAAGEQLWELIKKGLQ